MRKIEVLIPDWGIELVKCVYEHYGAEGFSIETMLARFIYEALLELVDTCLACNIPVENQKALFSSFYTDIEEVLWKLGVNDENITYSLLTHLMQLSSKYEKNKGNSSIEDKET